MKSIVFVRGFDTALSTEYLQLDVLLSNTYDFTYGPNEDLLDVYQGLLTTIDTIKPEILIGHNVGGGLLVKYVKSKNYKKEKIILLMPFICRNPILDLVSKFLKFHQVFDPKLVFPKAMFTPPFYNSKGSIVFNTDFTMVSFNQPYDMYMDNDIQLNDVFAFMEYNPNVTIFYAEDERLNTIDETTLQRILPNCRLIKGYWHSNNTDLFVRVNNRLTSRLSYLRNTVYRIMVKHDLLTENAMLYLIHRFRSAVHELILPNKVL